MVSIRENTFETNSSSMHCLTVACPLNDPNLYKDYLLKGLERWGNPEDGYKIEIVCDENNLDAGDFSIRSYIPHFSINDKLMYALATVMQHYMQDMQFPPYKPWNLKNLSQEEQQEYFKKKKAWKAKYSESNNKIIKSFEEKIHSIEDSLKFYIANKLGLIEEKVQVKLKYCKEDSQLTYTYDSTYFSTGCYGNEEFYFTLTNSYNSFAEWICNPYSAVLAGSDEQDTWETCLQDLEAKHCIEEAEKHKELYTDKEELLEDLESERNSDNSGIIDGLIGKLKNMESFEPIQSKVIYPLGG